MLFWRKLPEKNCSKGYEVKDGGEECPEGCSQKGSNKGAEEETKSMSDTLEEEMAKKYSKSKIIFDFLNVQKYTMY